METSPLEIVKLWKHPDRYRKRLIKRSEGDVAEALPKVQEIVSGVRKRGDIALLEYTERFDGVEMSRDQVGVSKNDISKAYDTLGEEDIEVVEKAAEAVKRFHEEQLPEDWMEEFGEGVKAGQVVRPLASVGAYAPGGTAQYPSSVLMSVIPAKVAGVERVIVCTPPNPKGGVDSTTLVAADIAGADEVYKVGGAQAIAAMAYGSKTISSVEKIVGPGNVYVAAAKKVVSSYVDIDFMAGPSEVLVLADTSADPRHVAVDLVAQAEHDSSSASVLVTTSERLAKAVSEEIESILESTPRRRTAAKALQEYGHAVVTKSLKKAIQFANEYAPEHLQIMVRDPSQILNDIENAGAIFIGPYSPTTVGDFAVGPSHILPTGGDASCYDGISVHDFVRLPSVQEVSKKGLKRLSPILERLAEIEGLPAHARSIRERLEED